MSKTSLAALIATALVTWSVNSHAQSSPAPSDPYPLAAAGWGPEAGSGLYYSRWVEDWASMRSEGVAPSLKALPLGKGVNLTFSTETRLRYDDGATAAGDNVQQGLLRNVLGVDLRFNPSLRLYAELGSGSSGGTGNATTANFENKQSLQQLFVEARTTVGSTLVGAMIGRQEFADGPRQLVSLSDGPNLHRTWNGTRLYLHGETLRIGAFDLRATRLGHGGFDETIAHAERLQGVNASLVVARGPDERNIYLEPFWLHSENPSLGTGLEEGADDRDTVGARFWGQRGQFRFDATLAHQSGHYAGRGIDAWGLFLVQSVGLMDSGWKPRLTAHVDAATGDRKGSGEHQGFNPLYSSSNYLGEGRFLALRNLLLVAPGVSVSPSAATNLSAEYGFARRLTSVDAAYGGGVRSYAGTSVVAGHQVGGLLRVSGSWSGDWIGNSKVTITGGYERLHAGEVLRSAQLGSAGYGYVSVTSRY
jgi:hypothetical protein